MQPQESLEVGGTRVCVCACGGGEIPTGESCCSACVQYECVHTHTHVHRAQNACYFTFNTSRGACTINRLVDKPTTRKPTAHFGPNRERERQREGETVCVGEQGFDCVCVCNCFIIIIVYFFLCLFFVFFLNIVVVVLAHCESLKE